MEFEDLRSLSAVEQEAPTRTGYRPVDPATHYMTKGTVIPKANKRAGVKGITRALPHLNVFKENIISEDEDGNQIIQRVDKSASDTQPRSEPVVAAKAAEEVEPPKLEALPENPLSVQETNNTALSDLSITDQGLKDKPLPKTKVTFIGSFGKLTVPYDHVHREGIYLVCTQHSETESFFEAPQSDLPLEVQLGTTTLMCYSGPQFRLSKTGKLFITVFLIDMEATEERNRGY